MSMFSLQKKNVLLIPVVFGCLFLSGCSSPVRQEETQTAPATNAVEDVPTVSVDEADQVQQQADDAKELEQRAADLQKQKADAETAKLQKQIDDLKKKQLAQEKEAKEKAVCDELYSGENNICKSDTYTHKDKFNKMITEIPTTGGDASMVKYHEDKYKDCQKIWKRCPL